MKRASGLNLAMRCGTPANIGILEYTVLDSPITGLLSAAAKSFRYQSSPRDQTVSFAKKEGSFSGHINICG